MSLKKTLRKQGYDLIDGPDRKHQPLQLWLKKINDQIEIYHENIDHAFISKVPLTEIRSDALNINYTKKDNYNFNIGLTVLEEILTAIGINNFKLSHRLSRGKQITISYDNAITVEYPIGNIENYLSAADFRHYNPALLKNLNRNNVLIISGVIFAKNLIVEIDTDTEINSETLAGLNNAADGKLDFSTSRTSKLKMTSIGTGFFPVAAKANRIIYSKGTFKNQELVTDRQDIF